MKTLPRKTLALIVVAGISACIPYRYALATSLAQQQPAKHVIHAGDAPGEDTIGLMDRNTVITLLQKAGYTNIQNLKLTGHEYKATASHGGKPCTVIVDARDGQTVSKST